MRTLSTAYADILNSNSYVVHARVEVEDSTGGFVDLGELSTANWLESLRWDWSLDQPVPELIVEFARDRGPSTGLSLAPLDAGSTFNYNSTGGFAALVYPGRTINVYTQARLPSQAAPTSASMAWVFQGEIDEVAWEQSPLQVTVRSKNMARLLDRWIEVSTALYGTSSGDTLHVTMQNLLADWTDLSTGILWSTDPAFLIAPEYSPDQQPVLSAVTAQAQFIGFGLQEKFSSSDAGWRIRLEEPNREATSSEKHWTFGPEHYYGVRNMAISRLDVRNKISVRFGPSSARGQVIAQSTSSQDAFGLRWMEFEEGSNSAIATSSEAEVLAQAALADLKDPPVTHEIEVPYFWALELGDYLEFSPNGIHYSVAQYLAVYGITHELGANRHRTRIRVRGQPAGQHLQWFEYPGGGGFPYDRNAVLHSDLTEHVTAASTALQVLSEFILPGGFLQNDGELVITAQWDMIGANGNKQIEIMYSTSTSVVTGSWFSVGFAASNENRHYVILNVKNNGDDSTQALAYRFWPEGATPSLSGGGVGGLNTSEDRTLAFAVILNSAADQVVMEQFEVIGRSPSIIE